MLLPTLFWQFVKPVAVDRHGDEEQHRYDNCRDDYSQRNVVFSGVVDSTHRPLAMTKLNLERDRDQTVYSSLRRLK